MPTCKALNEARATGKPTYFTGRPCASGHMADRYVSTRTCVICADIKAKRWQAENIDIRRVRANQRRREVLFGLNVFAYNAMLEKQGGGCAICGGVNEVTKRALAVDHDHSCCAGEKSCGKCVRGLLCDHCNHALGKFKDNSELLLRAVKYLRGELV